MAVSSPGSRRGTVPLQHAELEVDGDRHVPTSQSMRGDITRVTAHVRVMPYDMPYTCTHAYMHTCIHTRMHTRAHAGIKDKATTGGTQTVTFRVSGLCAPSMHADLCISLVRCR